MTAARHNRGTNPLPPLPVATYPSLLQDGYGLCHAAV